MIGSVLNIVPLMDVAPDGTLKVIEKIRGKKKVIERDVQEHKKAEKEIIDLIHSFTKR